MNCNSPDCIWSVGYMYRLACFLFAIFTLILPVSLQAQEDLNNRFSIAYFGEMISHPGLSVSHERDFYEFAKAKKKEALKNKKRSLYLGTEIGFFHHKRAINAGFTQVRLGFRKQGEQKSHWAIDMGNGYFLGFIPNSFKVENGVVSKSRNVNHYTMHSLNLTYGRQSKIANNTRWFVAPSFYITRPAFPNYTAHLALRIGVQKSFS